MQLLNKQLFKQLFFKQFVFTVLSLLLMAFCLNIFIDPRGEFGTGFLPVVVVATARSEKIQYLKEFDPKPNAFIMGSSRCMRYSPDVLNQLSQLTTIFV